MANNSSSIKVTCAKCGKEFELDEKWQGFAEKYPERITCFECKSGAKKDVATAYKNTPKKTSLNPYKKATSSPSTDKKVNAEMFRDAYEEIKEQFEDVLPEVKDFIGGWVSTIVINRMRERD